MDAMKFEAPTGPAGESGVNAKGLIEGVRRAGRDLTRDKLRKPVTGEWGVCISPGGALLCVFPPAVGG